MNLAIKLKDSFNRRCEDFLKIEKFYAATYLDPRFRTFKFISNKSPKIACIKKAYSLEVQLSHELQLTPTSLQLSSQEWSPSEEISSWKTKILLWDETVPSKDLLSVDDEIINYLNMNIKVSENSCPLAFYKNNFCKFPVLSKVVKMLFSITASSTPSEELFSSAGEIITKRRNRLKPGLGEKCVLLNQGM